MPHLQIGDTFIFAPGGHLWVVISDPSRHEGNCIIVNLTSNAFRAGNDCQLKQGDHPWIAAASYVTFGDARKVTPKEETIIVSLMTAGTIKKHHPMPLPILKKIIDSAKASKALPGGFLAYL